MAKEILLYGGVNTYSVERFIEEVNALGENDDLILRINTNGGSPEDMTGMIAKFQEFNGNKKIKVDGYAYSAGAFFLLYANSEDVEATDVSKLMLHRAAYPTFLEKDPKFMTEDRKSFLGLVNSNLRKALESKVDEGKFRDVANIGYDELFSLDTRIDVFLNAEQAKDLGLISKINKITPEKALEIKANYDSILASHSGCLFAEIKDESVVTVNKTNKQTKKMTIDEIKASSPEAYNQIVDLGRNQERDVAKSWLVFAEVDLTRVKAGITSGNVMSQTDLAEFTLKAISAKEVKSLEVESVQPLLTVPVTSAESEVDSFYRSYRENSKIG